jgi:hypothetical protein
MAIQATEAGKTLTLDGGGKDLTSFTCTAVVVNPQTGVRSTLALTVDSGSPPTTASRSTQATDFPDPGVWQIQLKAVDGSTTLLSPVQHQNIGPAL